MYLHLHRVQASIEGPYPGAYWIDTLLLFFKVRGAI